MTFQLDTSGYVVFPASEDAPWENPSVEWSDLNPFTQGYTDKVLRKIGAPFHMLAPETLTQIMNDCGSFQSTLCPDKSADMGRCFWQTRQNNFWESFPPLTPYLGEDGKVYLREAS